MSRGLGRDKRGRSIDMQVVQTNIFQVLARGKGIQQRGRRGRRSVDKHVHPASYDAESFFG